jgi:hypothetical protein
MKNSTLEITDYTDNCLVAPMPRVAELPRMADVDYDIPEIAIGFGRIPAANLRHTQRKDFSTNTLGDVTFRRVDPLREPFQVADVRLQMRLESLCEALRAKY